MEQSYYDTHAREYFQRTFHLDSARFLLPLASCLHPGAAILDLGCGSGRDLAWLRRQGFVGMGLDRAPRLAKMARAASGCPVIVGDFHAPPIGRACVDGVLLVAALVHEPPSATASILQSALEMLRPGGALFFSVKEGEGVLRDRTGRHFYLWQREALDVLLTELGCTRHTLIRQSSLLVPEERYLACLVRQAG